MHVKINQAYIRRRVVTFWLINYLNRHGCMKIDTPLIQR
jgi:hypothetical protein